MAAPATYPSSGCLPHLLITGKSGTGTTSELIKYIRRRAQEGTEIWAADPKRIGLAPVSGLPEVTRFATRVEDIAKLLQDAHAEMERRYESLEAGSPLDTFRPLVASVDEWPVFAALAGSWEAEQRGSAGSAFRHPSWRQIGELLAAGPGVGITLAVSAHSAFADGLLRDSLGNIQHIRLRGPHRRGRWRWSAWPKARSTHAGARRRGGGPGRGRRSDGR
jgi:hypothetical protein